MALLREGVSRSSGENFVAFNSGQHRPSPGGERFKIYALIFRGGKLFARRIAEEQLQAGRDLKVDIDRNPNLQKASVSQPETQVPPAELRRAS